jgi:hypothetical protein
MSDKDAACRAQFEEFLAELKAREPDQAGDFTRSYKASLYAAFAAGWERRGRAVHSAGLSSDEASIRPR